MEKVLTLCHEDKCCPVIEKVGDKIKIVFDDNTNTMTVGQFRILLAKGEKWLEEAT